MGVLSQEVRLQVVEALRSRYRDAEKVDKSRILNEFVALSGCHRKYAIRLLNAVRKEKSIQEPVSGERIYDEAVKKALIVIWETADRICGKRLKGAIPNVVDAMERHGHLKLDPEVRRKLLSVSPSTIDRLLKL